MPPFPHGLCCVVQGSMLARLGVWPTPLICSPEEESFQNISGSTPGLTVGDDVGVSLHIGLPVSPPSHQTANLDDVSIIISILSPVI
jgi:hypothetical protein